MTEDCAKSLRTKLEALKLPSGRRRAYTTPTEVGVYIGIGLNWLWVETANGSTISVTYVSEDSTKIHWDGPMEKVETFINYITGAK